MADRNDRTERRTTDAGEILHRVVGDDAELRLLAGKEKSRYLP